MAIFPFFNCRRAGQRGFSLIELLVALTIVGLLTSIAIPSYKQYVVKGKRSAAQAEMLDMANREQQYLLANRGYAAKTDLQAAGYSLPSNISALYSYDVTVGTSAAPSFTITLTPVSTGSQSSDGALTLTSEGVKSPSDKW